MAQHSESMETSNVMEMKAFNKQLNAVMETVPKGDIVIVMGDLNVKAGSFLVTTVIMVVYL